MPRLKMPRVLCLVWVSVILLAVGLIPAQAGGLVTDCSTFGSGAGTLGAALAGGGNIAFACSGTILVPEMVIAADTTINASGQQVILSGNLTNRIFNVNAGVSLTLEYVTVAYGLAGNGAGILNNGGTVTLSRSTLLGNQGGNGGGLHNLGGTAIVVNSTITQNRAQGSNGGGGGILNSAGSTLTITNSTIAENRAIVGGGLFNAGGTATIRNTIIAQNLIIGNCANTGTFNGSGNNLADDGSCLGFTVTTAARLLLGTLQGIPAHYPLIIGSPAIDKGNNTLCKAAPVNGIDQRGLKRPYNATNDLKKTAICDIGASEWIYPIPDVPLCADFDGSTNKVVRAVLPPVNHGIHCRILVENGVFRENSSSIGNAEVLSRTIIQAVDVFSLYDVSAAGSLICLYGSGGILFLDAAGAPREPVVLPVIQEDEGYRCILLPNVGTLVLVTDTSGLPVLDILVRVQTDVLEASGDNSASASAATVSDLVGCRVTTTAMLNLRAEPSLSAAVVTVLPYDLTLDATAKSEGWYRVIYGDGQGWVSAGYVSTRGSCG